MFVESTSFAASAGVGIAAANVGAFLLALTPFGWIGLIIDGVIVAGAAETVSIRTDSFIKANSGRWYDGGNRQAIGAENLRNCSNLAPQIVCTICKQRHLNSPKLPENL
jgi:hypothetical protein